MIVYTLVDPALVHAVKTASEMLGVRCVDLWTPLLDSMEGHLHSARRYVPGFSLHYMINCKQAVSSLLAVAGQH
jgi:regulator of PEP synthase PpsR (kinase-PPPase family)